MRNRRPRRLDRALLLGLLGLVAPALAAAATPGAGQRAFDQGRFADALAAWSPLAARGNPRAELGLGVLYDLGDGVGQDARAALGWYRKAAEAGLADAELNVAVMYDSGRGTPRDAAAAALWYARAAAHHDHRAEYDLAQLYEAGDGVPKNPALAASWLRAAAAGGLDAAGERLRVHAGAALDVATARLVAAAPLAPAESATIARAPPIRSIELVWTAAPQPVPARFYVQVLALDPPEPVQVFSGYTDQSALLAPLAPDHAEYAWRVYVVGGALRSYLPSPWVRFSIAWRDPAAGEAAPAMLRTH